MRKILLIIFPFFGFTMYSTDPIEKVKSSLEKYLVENSQEKVFIHTDKPYYSTGDTIWFKVYVTAGFQDIPTTLSKVAYVQLVNERSGVIQQNTLKLKQGVADGYIFLPDSLRSSVFSLRGFTKWMLNFDSKLISDQPLKIWNPNQIEVDNTTSIQQKREVPYDVQFFPEGGELVVGLQSKIGVKAVNQFGNGVKISGSVINLDGEVVNRFTLNELGMGFFPFTPKVVSGYKVILEEAGGEYSLPSAKETGSTIFVTNKAESEEVIVKIQSTYPSDFYLVIDTRGVLCYISKIKLVKGFTFVKIPKKDILSGISHITLFNQELIPLAERLIFLEGSLEASLKISTNKKVYAPREQVEIYFELSDSLIGQKANLSATFIDSRSLFYDKYNADVSSHLKLSSELNGNIESPGYYFDRENPARFDAQESLMLTQGWIRFTWKQLNDPLWPTIKYVSEQSLTLEGKLLDKFNGKPVEGGNLTYFEGMNFNDGVITTKSRKDGSFSFTGLEVYDTSSHEILAENKRGNNEVVRIELENSIPLMQSTYPHLIPDLKIFERTMIDKTIRSRSIDKAYEETKTIVLEGIEVKSTRTKKDPDNNFYGKGTNSIQASQIVGYETFSSPLQLLQGRVPGVQVIGSGYSTSVQIRGTGSVSAGNNPLILFDNLPISVGSINSIPILSIESVEVFKGADAAIFGTQGANGVIAFFSKRGSDFAVRTPGSRTIQNWGYHVSRMRYKPMYDVKRAEHVKPDERITIHWEPNIEIGADGKSVISFFNSDLETTVEGYVQGITSNGIPIVQKISYQVVK